MKLLALLVIALVVFRLCAGRWPWEGRPPTPALESRDKARALLGVPAHASREDIVDAHRRLVAIVHPDRGGSSELVHEANAARDLLLGDLPSGGRPSRG